MKTTVTRVKALNEIIEITREGKIIVEGNEEPTDLQISQAIRKYARQYGNVNKVNNDERFLLRNAHPMISADKGTIKSKAEWMEEYGWDEDKFMQLKETAVLTRR